MKYLNYEILINNNRETKFMPSQWILEHKGSIDLTDYSLEYQSTIGSNEKREGYDRIFVLEKIYQRFNRNHPKDYKSRSLSVGDIVKLENYYYMVESIGFKKLRSTSIKKKVG